MANEQSDKSNATPRCDDLDRNRLDSSDDRAWAALARQLERELAEAEWKAAHRLEMFNQRETLMRDLQAAAMAIPSSTASNLKEVAVQKWQIPDDDIGYWVPLSAMPSAIESPSVGELTAKVLANGHLYDGLQHFRNGNWATSVLVEHILKLALASDDIGQSRG